MVIPCGCVMKCRWILTQSVSRRKALRLTGIAKRQEYADDTCCVGRSNLAFRLRTDLTQGHARAGTGCFSVEHPASRACAFSGKTVTGIDDLAVFE